MRHGAQATRNASPSRAKRRRPWRLSTERPSSRRSTAGVVAKRARPGTLSATSIPRSGRRRTTQASAGVVSAPPEAAISTTIAPSVATPSARPPQTSSSARSRPTAFIPAPRHPAA
jgi:hypothetical protein